MHTLNFGVYQLFSITTAYQTMFHECSAFRSGLLAARCQSTHKRCNLEGCSWLSIEGTPSDLIFISSFKSLLTAKPFSINVRQSVQGLGLYRIIIRLKSKSYTRGKLGRAVVGCPSNAHPQLRCLFASLHHLCLLNFVPWVRVYPFKIKNFLQHNQQPCCHTIH